MEIFIPIYLVIGLAYVMINGFIRKIYDDDEDWLLATCHMLIWPMFFLAALVWLFNKKS